MKFNSMTGALAALVLAGCAAPRGPMVFVLKQPFAEAAAADQVQDGQETVRGQAFMRQQGGGVVTCAGADVRLTPVTAYAQERIRYLYGMGDEGMRPAYSQAVVFEPEPEGYYRNTRTTRCDAQGSFVFERVKAGEYYITTLVTWVVANTPQGGALMRRVTVRDGEPMTVLLSR